MGDEEEDLNQDGNFDAQDCQGQNGDNGADGLNCWDTNGNGVADAEEDVNEDGNFNAMDCQGANGDDGENGTSCWDINGNGVGDADEDLNEDGDFNALDCQGEDGADGNANVQRFDILLDGFNDDFIEIDISEQALPTTDYAYIVYLLDSSGQGNDWFSVPGFLSITAINNVYCQVKIESGFNLLVLRFFDSSNLSMLVDVPEGELLALRYFAIRVNEDQASRGGSKGVYDDLKAAGVDVSDYHQVAKYFGYTD